MDMDMDKDMDVDDEGVGEVKGNNKILVVQARKTLPCLVLLVVSLSCAVNYKPRKGMANVHSPEPDHGSHLGIELAFELLRIQQNRVRHVFILTFVLNKYIHK